MKTNTHFFIILLGFIFTILAGCKKEPKEAILSIKVLDPNNNPAAGIKLDILEVTDNISSWDNKLVSSSSGEANILLTKGKSYYVYLIASESYTDWYMGNPTAQLKITGVFQSLDEINYSAIQKPTPVVGDIKYADINGDGIITVDDLLWKLDLKDDTQITVNLVSRKM